MSHHRRPHELRLAISSEAEALISGAGMLEDGGGAGVGGMPASEPRVAEPDAG